MQRKLLAILICAVSARAVAAQPQLTCELIPRGSEGSRPERRVRFGNLDEILVSLTLRAPDTMMLDAPRPATSASGPANVNCKVVTASGESAGMAKARVAGSSQRGANSYDLSLILEVPLDPTTRRVHLERYIEQSAAAPKPGEEQLALVVSKKPQVLMSMLDNMYRESRVGDFDVTCAYSSQRDGYWKGEVSSKPLQLSIVFTKSFFEQPQFSMP